VVADPTFYPGTEQLVADGRGGDDRIFGTTRADVIDGGPGADFANGWDGDDACTNVEIVRSC